MENTLKTLFAGIAQGLCEDGLLSATGARRICLNEKLLVDPAATARFLEAVSNLPREKVRGGKSVSNRWVCACLESLAQEIRSAGMRFEDLFANPQAGPATGILLRHVAGTQKDLNFDVEGCGLPGGNSLVIRKCSVSGFGSALATVVYASWGEHIEPVCRHLCDTSGETGFLVFKYRV